MTVILPFDAVSGKLSPVNERVGDNGYGTGRYYVAFQRSYGNKTMFQARTKARSTPVSSGELEQRSKFRVCVTEMETQMQDPAHSQVFVRKFRAQLKYATLRGFAMAEAYKYYNDTTHTVDWPSDYWN